MRITKDDERIVVAMEPQFEELAGRITKDVSEAVTARVAEVLAAAERRLSERAQVNVEAVKYEARLAAEGYGAMLESIERELKEFRAEWR